MPVSSRRVRHGHWANCRPQVCESVTGCKGRRRYKLRKVRSYRARFGAKHVRFTVRRPRGGFYTGRFSFAGTHFLRAVVDPDPLRLLVLRKRMQYVQPRDFAGCPGYRP